MSKQSKEPWDPKVGDMVRCPNIAGFVTRLSNHGPITWLSEDKRFAQVRITYGSRVNQIVSFKTADLQFKGRKE
jgi:hypothetical protein